MSEAKFTKGPWSVYAAGERWGIEADNSVFSIVIFGDEDDDLGIHGRDIENMKANAHLIAAAPEMYEALEWLECYADAQVRRHPDAEDSKNWALVLSALAKARGEQ